MSPKNFLIIYFDAQDAQSVSCLKRNLDQFFVDKNYLIQLIVDKIGSLIFISEKEILQGTINKIVEIITDQSVEILYLHHTDSPMDKYRQYVSSEPACVISFGVVLKEQTFWDYILFRRSFFLLNHKQIISGSSCYTDFYVCGDYLIFYLQSKDQSLEPELDFYKRTLDYYGLKYLLNVV